MTVQELINKLQTLNPDDEVLIEVDHDEIVPLKENRVVEDLLTPDNRLSSASSQWFCPGEKEVDARKAVVLRA